MITKEHVNQLIKDFINNLNIRDNNFFILFSIHSKIIYESMEITNNSIIDFWSNFNYKLNVIKYDINIVGDRRANILLSGKIDENKNFSMYILLAIDNHKKYWIHSLILQIF